MDDVNLIGDDIRTIERNADVLLNVCRDIGLAVNIGKINEALGGIDQPSTTYLAFGKYLKRSGNTIRTFVSYL